MDGKLYLFSSIPAKEVVDKDPGVLARATPGEEVSASAADGGEQGPGDQALAHVAALAGTRPSKGRLKGSA